MKALLKVISHPVYRIRKTFVILECILKEEKEIGEREREREIESVELDS